MTISNFWSEENEAFALESFGILRNLPDYRFPAVEIVTLESESQEHFFPMTHAQRQKAYRERQKALKAKLPDLLNMLARNNAPQIKPPELENVNNEALPVFDSVICDWLTISHPLREAYPVVNDGQILKLNADGSHEWSSECWLTLKCASSDTSLRIKCDGQKVMMTGNIGRFGQSDNLNGHTVAECLVMWRDLLVEYFPARTVRTVKPLSQDEFNRGLVSEIVTEHYPALNIADFFAPDVEMLNRLTGEIELSGTRITRCDLAGNFYTDNFASLTAMMMTRKLGQRAPRMGKYGAMWGYDSKRSNWLKAKLYDKTCELEGRRTPATGETTARFEVQLGSEILKRRGLHIESGWMEGKNMENITYLEYSNQVFREQATAESWLEIPSRIRQYAVLWRDGTPLRNQCQSDATYYRIRKQLLGYGIDASQPCNVMTLVRRIETVKVMPLQARRAA